MSSGLLHLVSLSVSGFLTNQLIALHPFDNSNGALICRQRQLVSPSFDLDLTLSAIGRHNQNHKMQIHNKPYEQLHPLNLTIKHTSLRRISSKSKHLSYSCADFSWNKLTEWPQFECSSALTHLNLSYNRLRFWNMGDFINLEVLDLTGNYLDRIDLQSLLRMPRLRVLLLAGNPINFYGSLNKVPNLQTVVLAKDRWYAVNNIDFGAHPIDAIMTDERAKVRRLKFTCNRFETRQWGPEVQAEFLDLSRCQEVFLDGVARLDPNTTCLACFWCRDRINQLQQINRLIDQKSPDLRSSITFYYEEHLAAVLITILITMCVSCLCTLLLVHCSRKLCKTVRKYCPCFCCCFRTCHRSNTMSEAFNRSYPKSRKSTSKVTVTRFSALSDLSEYTDQFKESNAVNRLSIGELENSPLIRMHANKPTITFGSHESMIIYPDQDQSIPRDKSETNEPETHQEISILTIPISQH